MKYFRAWPLFIWPLFIWPLLLANCAEPGDGISLGEPMSVEIFAGSLTEGFAEGQGVAARFNGPQGIAVSPNGNIYVTTSSNRIRKVTPSGLVSTLAGSGQETKAQFNLPSGIAVSLDGSIYVGDRFNHKVRKITPSGSVDTLAGSSIGFADKQGTEAKFNAPTGIAVGPNGNIYVVDTANNRIREVTPSGLVSTLAGSGTASFADEQGTKAQFNAPNGIAVGPDGNVYVADTNNNRIRKVTPSGLVSTLAGSTSGFADGQGTAAKFNKPSGITVGPDGNIYVADTGNNRIRRISPSGKVSTIIESLDAPKGIAFTPNGAIAYIADGNRIIRARFR